MTWPPHQMTWHASKQVTSPPWNSRRLVHSKDMVWASRWSVALRTFYRQILSLLYSSFFFWNFRPRLARELLVYHLYIAFWGVICYLAPFRGTPWINHWNKSWGPILQVVFGCWVNENPPGLAILHHPEDIPRCADFVWMIYNTWRVENCQNEQGEMLENMSYMEHLYIYIHTTGGAA